MAITLDAAKQLMADGKMSQKAFNRMLKRGSISNEKPFKQRIKVGQKGSVIVKLVGDKYVGVRMYPEHYKQKTLRIETTSRPEIEKFWETHNQQVTSQYYGVDTTHLPADKVAVPGTKVNI